MGLSHTAPKAQELKGNECKKKYKRRGRSTVKEKGGGGKKQEKCELSIFFWRERKLPPIENKIIKIGKEKNIYDGVGGEAREAYG